MKEKEFETPYEAGFDAGRNGIDKNNGSVRWFSTPERTKEWERGHDIATGKIPSQHSNPTSQTDNNLTWEQERNNLLAHAKEGWNTPDLIDAAYLAGILRGKNRDKQLAERIINEIPEIIELEEKLWIPDDRLIQLKDQLRKKYL